MKYSLALHLIGMIMWVGGVLFLSRVMKLMLNSGGSAAVMGAATKRIFFGWIVPGLLVTTVSGMYQLSIVGLRSWMHMKLTLLLGLFVITFLLHAEVRKINSGGEVNAGRLGMVHGLSGALLILIVFVTMVLR